MNTTITTLFACEVLGTAAFKNGTKAAPCLDRKLMEMMKGFELGNPMSIPMMDAWLKGWHGANLAKAITNNA